MLNKQLAFCLTKVVCWMLLFPAIGLSLLNKSFQRGKWPIMTAATQHYNTNKEKRKGSHSLKTCTHFNPITTSHSGCKSHTLSIHLRTSALLCLQAEILKTDWVIFDDDYSILREAEMLFSVLMKPVTWLFVQTMKENSEDDLTWVRTCLVVWST